MPGTAAEEVIPLGRAVVRVPILQYHYIRINPDRRDIVGFNLSVTPNDFTAQMDWLADHGYHPVDLGDLRAYLQRQRPLPAKPVVLTFDDGFADFYTSAYPVLAAHHFKAVAYIVPGFLQGGRYLTPDQVKELDQQGIEIGSHTFDHLDLTHQSPGRLWYELTASRAYLEHLLGHPVLDFSYPVGRYNAQVALAVAQAGYQSATTQAPGLYDSWQNRFVWPRIRVGGGEGLAAFGRSLGVAEPTVTIQVPVLPTAPPSPRPALPKARGTL